MDAPEHGRHGFVERIDEDHKPAPKRRGSFASRIHGTEQHIGADRLQTELIRDAPPQVAVTELRTS
jgi:hypothetical protein